MGTKSFYIGPNKEQNGKSVVSFGFTYSELRDLDEALDEFYDYWRDMLSNHSDREHRADVLGRIGSLQMKVDMYRSYALRNLEEEE
tara:strand:- start:252 stop:509 length:258 start_codon:yes stop_codon:yes gene_type:complete